MDADWEGIIERNRAMLLGIVMTLFAMAGLDMQQGGLNGHNSGTVTLPRWVRRAIMLVLRPAESAIRRLIVIAACGLSVTLPPLRARKPRKPKPEPAPMIMTVLDTDGAGGIISRYVELKIAQVPIDAPATATGNADPAAPDGAAASFETGADAKVPAFPLIDPLKRFACFRPRGGKRRYTPAHLAPRITIIGVTERRPLPPPPPPPRRDDELNAGRLVLRLRAMKGALDDIPAQARRLALWEARRDQGRLPRARYRSPLRPGYPPGHRRRHIHEIDAILDKCHAHALYALDEARKQRPRAPKPDTS